jgi:hypothetical protein
VTGLIAGGVSRGVKALAACVLVLFAATLAAGVESGHACSCALPDPRAALARADGAFVGKLISRRDADLRAVLTFSVEKSLKGRIAGTVDVVTASNGAACGIEAPIGTRVGLVLERRDGAWHGHLCWLFAPEELLAAALPLPAPNGRGPVALVVGGAFGPMRLLALDRHGRTLAYGRGSGQVGLVSVCPGAQRLAEIAYPGSRTELVIRATGTLRLLRRQALTLPGQRYAHRLACENTTGSSVVVFARGPFGNRPTKSALYRASGGRLHALWSGVAYDAAITSSDAYLSAGLAGDSLERVDLQTGRVSRVATLPGALASLALNPAGTILAGIGVDSPWQIVRVDLTARPANVKSVRFASRDAYGQVLCLPTGNFVVISAYGDASARVLDAALRTWDYFRWPAGPTALVGSRLFGIDHSLSLFRAELSGPMRVVRQLPGRPTVIVSATR